MKAFLSSMFKFSFGSIRTRQIMNDPQLRPKSVRFGVMCIVFSVFTMAMSCLALLMPVFKGQTLGVFWEIFIGLLAILGTLYLWISSLGFFLNQRILNKNWATKTSMIMFIIATLVAVGVIVTSFVLTLT